MALVRLPKIGWGVAQANTLALLIDTSIAYPALREGSLFAKSPAGEEDSIITGTDQFLGFNARWIPNSDIAAPYPQTGWDGTYGWNSFLRWAWQKNIFYWYADRYAVLNWLAVGDANWTNVNAATRTPTALWVNGAPLDLISDTSGVSQSYYTRNAVMFIAGATAKTVTVWVCAGTTQAASGSSFRLYDVTAAAYRFQANIRWTGAVPNVTMGGGSLISQSLVGVTALGSVYQLTFASTAITIGNTHQILAMPAEIAAEQGNIYMGNVQAWDDALVRPVNPPGAVIAQPCLLTTPAVLADLQNMTLEEDGTSMLPVVIRATDDTPFMGY